MYDPLFHRSPGCGELYPASYWADFKNTQSINAKGSSAELNMLSDDGAISQDMEVDIVIIGAGYTGLSCSLHVARDHGIKAHV